MHYQSEPVGCEQFLNYLDKLPWCKQGDNTLVAVHSFAPEMIEMIKHHDVKVYPGSMIIKMTKSTLHMLESKFKEGEPVPLLLVWKEDGLEISFRTHKSGDFPYDTWNNPAGEAYEREAVFILTDELGEKAENCFKKHLKTTKICPVTVPKL